MPILFDSWGALGRIILVGALAYFALVLILRASGKRTLSKLNAFDLVVTVALGSTLATVLLSKDVALAEGVVALLLLVCLQYAVTFTSVRWRWFDRIVKSEPTLLVYDGRYLDDAMRRQRLTRQELFAALRKHGVDSVRDASVVVLETDGEISVVPQQHQKRSVMQSVPHNALVVVADGQKAVLFRNEGVPGDVKLRHEGHIQPGNLASDGPSGSRPEEQTRRQTDEATFAKQLARKLFLMKEHGSFDHLVLIADPQTLGQLRQTLHKTVESSLQLTVNKDLTNQSAEEIASALRN